MSWEPIFWIKFSDFYKYEHLFKNYNVWEFEISQSTGVIIQPEGGTSRYRQLHHVFIEYNIPHWIFNGECAECDLCMKWGSKLHEYKSED